MGKQRGWIEPELEGKGGKGERDLVPGTRRGHLEWQKRSGWAGDYNHWKQADRCHDANCSKQQR